jgi:hypothetical protein
VISLINRYEIQVRKNGQTQTPGTNQRWDQVPRRSKYFLSTNHTRRAPYFRCKNQWWWFFFLFWVFFVFFFFVFFLHSYVVDFIQKLLHEKRKKNALAFSSTPRYIDDVLSINNNQLHSYVDSIYPNELEIKDITVCSTSASYLDVLLKYWMLAPN